MASDLYDRILRVERRLRAIDLDSLSHRQRANAFALSTGAISLGDIWGQKKDGDSGCTGTLSVRTYLGDNPQAGVVVTVMKDGIWVAEGTTTLPSISTYAFVDFAGLPPGTYTAAADIGGGTRAATVEVVCRETAIAVLNTPQETVACCSGTVLLPKTVLITDPAGSAHDLTYDATSGLFLTAAFPIPLAASCGFPGDRRYQFEWNCGTKLLKLRQYNDYTGNPTSFFYSTGNPYVNPNGTGTCSPLNLTYEQQTFCDDWTGPCCNQGTTEPNVKHLYTTITPKP